MPEKINCLCDNEAIKDSSIMLRDIFVVLLFLTLCIMICLALLPKNTYAAEVNFTIDNWISNILNDGVYDEGYLMSLNIFMQKLDQYQLANYYTLPVEFSVNFNRINSNNSVGIIANLFIIDGENRIPRRVEMQQELEESYALLLMEFRRVLRNLFSLVSQIKLIDGQEKLYKSALELLEYHGFLASNYYHELLYNLELLSLEKRRLNFYITELTGNQLDLLNSFETIIVHKPLDLEKYSVELNNNPWREPRYVLSYLTEIKKEKNDESDNTSLIVQGKVNSNSITEPNVSIALIMRTNDRNKYVRSSTSAEVNNDDFMFSYSMSSLKTLNYRSNNSNSSPLKTLHEVLFNMELLVERYEILFEKNVYNQKNFSLNLGEINPNNINGWITLEYDKLSSKTNLNLLLFEILLMQGKFDTLIPIDYDRQTHIYIN